jgi:pimeloyl-ACP methyl ester carboxylesterase
VRKLFPIALSATTILALLLLYVPASAEELSFVPKGETEPEPYLIEKPASTEPGMRHPLIVWLHGRGGDHKGQWRLKGFTQFRKRAAERGYFVLCPHLGTDHWMNARARRVLTEMLDKTLMSYPIDKARVHMMGMSMGGGGSLIYTMHNKGRVRSVCNIFGVTDYTQFLKDSPQYKPSMSKALGGTPDTIPDVYRAQSVMDHLDAFEKLPILVLHGDADMVVPVHHSRQFVNAMKKRGYNVRYKEVPGGRHLSSFIQGFEDEILDFFDATGEPDAPDQGAFEADRLPDKSPQVWTIRGGNCRQVIDKGRWVVREPGNFLRGVEFGQRDRRAGQQGEVEIRWATDCPNNYSADGLRIVTQGRAFRIHPLFVPDGRDRLLVGTPFGMRPDLSPCAVDLTALPEFKATQLNTYRIRWTTNAEDDYQFELTVNDKSLGKFRGEPWGADEPHGINLEFRAGQHTIDYLRWDLYQGGERVDAVPPVLGHEAQLLFDDHLVEEYRGLTRTIHQPEMHPANPVLTWEEPWEYAAVLLWGTVLYDEQEQLFKMWYMTWGNEAGGALPGYRTPLCYATSKDGVHWKRPEFTHCPFKLRNLDDPDGPPLEYPVNNIVLNRTDSEHGMDSPTIVKDINDPDPARRYKLSCWHRLPTGTGIYHAHSPDGIHWKTIPERVVHSGDRNTFHWEPFRKKWIVVTRPNGSFYELEEFGRFNNNLIQVSIGMLPEDSKPPHRFTDVYSCPVFNYEGMQIALPELYGRNTTNRWVSYLAWSHDGRRWTRDPERLAWMPWSKTPGDFDCWRRNIHNGGVIRRGDKLWIYFSGRSQGKDLPDQVSGYLVPSGEPGNDPRGIVGSIGIGILRLDGFVSRDADAKGGSLRTRPFQFTGSQLEVNADVKPGGSIRVGLVDESGAPISGFGRGDCDPVKGDGVAQVVSWRGESDLAALGGKVVRLEMSLSSADLYSFRFNEPEGG